MSNYRAHTCEATDEMGDHLAPKMVTCGIKGHSWCERCDPAPSALCPICHGYGYTAAPIPPRQAHSIERARAGHPDPIVWRPSR